MCIEKENPVIPLCVAHEEYERLLVLATSGALAEEEFRHLAGHLRNCVPCRNELGRYQEIAGFGISLIAPNEVTFDLENEWSPESAVAKLMQKLSAEGSDHATSVSNVLAISAAKGWLSRLIPTRFVAFAAAVIVVLAVTLLWDYDSRSREVKQLAFQSGELSRLLREKSALQQNVEAQARRIEDLSDRLKEQKSVVEELQIAKQSADTSLAQLTGSSKSIETADAALRTQLVGLQNERAALEKKLQDSEVLIAALQRNFEEVRNEHAADLAQINRLELQVSANIREPRPAEVVHAKQVTIREPDLQALMGARDLFIADVYDIDKSGSPREPFGRVFYTRGKSLLFYAFDLDTERVARGTFQVWGRRGYGDTHPLNMGKMYLESEASGRWVLNYSDAKELARVDAVFVTIEPKGGSDVPKGRRLLYASLRTPPNHP